MTLNELLVIAKKAVAAHFNLNSDWGDSAEAMKAMLELRDAIAEMESAQQSLVESPFAESQAPLKLTETEACEKLNLIAIPIDNSELSTAIDVCKQCALHEKDACYKVDCMTNNVYFKAKA